ncbi:MAG: undecaprenyl-diphosphate phosphatase [Pseudomonadota bacterium]
MSAGYSVRTGLFPTQKTQTVSIAMSLFQLIVLSVVQGITEWLPISSSGHVLLVAAWFGLLGEDELLINAMAHIGTLGSVLLYFRKDVWRAIKGGLSLVGFKADPADRRLALLILAATPIAVVIAAGFAVLPDEITLGLRSLWVVIGTTIGFGVLLWWADQRPGGKGEADMSFFDATLIGASQAVAAILPGTSRSGITMTIARARGVTRPEAARFSMLIGIPIIAASGAYAFLELASAEAGVISLTLQDGLIVAALSFVAGYASIAVLMALLQRMSFLPFVIYRLALGAALLLASPVGLALIPA